MHKSIDLVVRVLSKSFTFNFSYNAEIEGGGMWML